MQRSAAVNQPGWLVFKKRTLTWRQFFLAFNSVDALKSSDLKYALMHSAAACPLMKSKPSIKTVVAGRSVSTKSRPSAPMKKKRVYGALLLKEVFGNGGWNSFAASSRAVIAHRREAGSGIIYRAGLLLCNGDQVLVVRERNRWSDFGGKIEVGETALDCAMREFQEEVADFLPSSGISLLATGLRLIFVEREQKPEVAFLDDEKVDFPQGIVVFLMDISGLDLPIKTRDKRNGAGVLNVSWISRHHPDLKDPTLTRRPLQASLRALERASPAINLLEHLKALTGRGLPAFAQGV